MMTDSVIVQFLLWVSMDWICPRYPVKGYTCLVTGSAGGLGFIICKNLIKKHVKAVILVDLNQKAINDAMQKLKDFAREQKSLAKVYGYACNVADSQKVYEMAAKVKQEVGMVDMLVNNAGIVSGKPFLQLSEEQIKRTFDVNTLAHFWTLKAFLPDMVKTDKGVVVTISSAGGIVGTNGLADYSGSKFAVYGLDEALRLDLKKAGSKVHTLCVCPFYINTGMFDGVKTKVPLLLPILEAEDVAAKIVDAVERRAHYLEIPSFSLQFAWISKVFPTSVRDKLLDLLGITSSMDDFKGRSKL